MAINKKLIHFKTKAVFDEKLANNEILDTSIVFIQDSRQIWTHGQLYNCYDQDLSKYLTEDDLKEINDSISNINTELDVLETSVVDLTSDQTISGSKTFTSSKGLTLYNTNASDSELDIYSDASGNKIINNINKGSSTVASGMEINNFTGSTIKIRTYMPGDDVVRAYCTVSPDRSGTICANYLLPNDVRRAAGLFISNGSEERGGASVGVNYGGLVTVYPPDNSDSPTKGVNSVTLLGDVVFRSYKDGLSGGDGNYAWMKYDSDDNFIDIRAITPSTNTTYETPILIDSVKINGERIITECIEITYSELKTRRDNSQLIPGAFYRIIDYVTTTSQTNTRSAEHQFDLIVTADDEKTLNEKARAIQHDGDTYFADSDLNAWEIWYCLDNDTERFAWADAENGKGVIYRMIDEFNNDIPYDFKNIQFRHPKDTTTYPYYYYTFSVVIDGYVTDYSMLQGNCYSNTMKEYINSNSKKQSLNRNVFLNTSKTSGCHSNSFGNFCYNNSFGSSCSYNSFGNGCYYNSFEDYCRRNSFGNECYYNSFRTMYELNSFGNNCRYNSFGNNCGSNSFGNGCHFNSFGNGCYRNSFGNGCEYNIFGNYCYSNSFGNGCEYNSFKSGVSENAPIINNCQYNHFDDGCSYNVIWSTTNPSDSNLLRNINVNRGVSGTSSLYNYININILNSEQEININQIDGIVSIGDILSIRYNTLKSLRDNGQLIAGQQYRIIDYVTTTSQTNTRSAEHQFDIIVTALNENTLSEEAQAIQDFYDGYFDKSNLSAWKLWYCLDNDTDRFAWAGDKLITSENIEVAIHDSSECTIKSELIDGNEFITPFNFESCVWVDASGNGEEIYGTNHDEIELVYEWGYFTDDDDNTHLCLYKSDAGLYEEEGQPDYGDKYLYRGVITVDGTDYDYWQKWDATDESINISDSGNHVYATTPRIVANPDALSFETTNKTIETIIQLNPKGVIYRMIDEFGNDCPYDFKNIQFKRKLTDGELDTENGIDTYCYTFNAYCVEDSDIYDASVIAHKDEIEDDTNRCYENVIKEYDCTADYNVCLKLNDIVFLNVYDIDNDKYFHCYSNTFGNYCYSNTFGDNCYSNTFGNECYSNSFGTYCSSNSFGNDCDSNSFGDYCRFNLFGDSCLSNFVGDSYYSNSFGNNCQSNSFGNNCSYNSFGNGCSYNSFRVSADNTSALKGYVRYNHFDDGCSYNVIWNRDTTNNNVLLKNINVNRGVKGTDKSYNYINITTLNQDYELQVAKNSKGEIKIYCEADLIA